MTDASELSGGDRVGIEPAMHQLYKDLADQSTDNLEASPFPTMKDIFMWAVALGLKSGQRRALSGRTPIFRWDQFSQDFDVPVLRSLAIAETEDVEVLTQEERILRIAEEYANAGIRELKEELVDQAGQPLWNLVGTVKRGTG